MIKVEPNPTQYKKTWSKLNPTQPNKQKKWSKLNPTQPKKKKTDKKIGLGSSGFGFFVGRVENPAFIDHYHILAENEGHPRLPDHPDRSVEPHFELKTTQKKIKITLKKKVDFTRESKTSHCARGGKISFCIKFLHHFFCLVCDPNNLFHFFSLCN